MLFNIGTLFNTGIHYDAVVKNSLKNDFWFEVFTCYEQFIDLLDTPDVNNVLNMPLFYNHKLNIGKEHFFIKAMYDRGIRFVRDIVIDSNLFLSKTQI